VILVAWLMLRGVPWARATVDQITVEVEQQAMLLERSRHETSSLAALSDSITTLEETAGQLDRLLLTGTDAQTARFDLTRRVALVLSRSPGWVADTTEEPDSVVAGPLARASVRTVLETDVVGLMEMVRNLELDPSLSVDLVSVDAEDPDVDQAHIERLHVTLLISGWFKGANVPLQAEDSR
jgi:hypothetical protein